MIKILILLSSHYFYFAVYALCRLEEADIKRTRCNAENHKQPVSTCSPSYALEPFNAV